MVNQLGAIWSNAPWTLRVYVAAGEFLALLNAVVYRTAFSEIMAVLFVVLSYYLLKRVRWLWFVMVAGTAVYFVGYLLVLGINAITNGAALVLLLAPATRRHFSRDRSSPRTA
jgi:uncharacterized membrane protein YagU involved in acid resistance